MLNSLPVNFYKYLSDQRNAHQEISRMLLPQKHFRNISKQFPQKVPLPFQLSDIQS